MAYEADLGALPDCEGKLREHVLLSIFVLEIDVPDHDVSAEAVLDHL